MRDMTWSPVYDGRISGFYGAVTAELLECIRVSKHTGSSGVSALTVPKHRGPQPPGHGPGVEGSMCHKGDNITSALIGASIMRAY